LMASDSVTTYFAAILFLFGYQTLSGTK